LEAPLSPSPPTLHAASPAKLVLERPRLISFPRCNTPCRKSIKNIPIPFPLRSIGYFVEAVAVLCLFAKSPTTLSLRGVTNDSQHVSADLLRTVSLPLLKRFGVDGEMELRVVKRGAKPLGGGEVLVRIPVAKELKPIDLTEEGKVKKVRGLA
jgi:hypothetical protein